MMRNFCCAVLFLTAAVVYFPSTSVASPFLPIYIEDNHAGSFYWLASNLNWNENYHLILFDHHSDATAVFRSDFIRKMLADRKDSNDDKINFASWKTKGIIQCFNWIEPLLPHPISTVTWVPANKLSPDELIAKRDDVINNINQYTSVVPRASGNLENIYNINDFVTQKNHVTFADPVIVTIDLDYFADTPNDEIEGKFAEIFNYVLQIKQLQAITVSISRPYLKSDAQADLLLFISLKYLSQIINAKIYFEPFTSHGLDRSELARSYFKKGLTIPLYDIRKASSRLRSLILQNPRRYVVNLSRKRWDKIIEKWSKKYKQPELVLSNKGHILPTQPFYYLYYKDTLTISVNMPFVKAKDYSIYWKTVSPVNNSYNIIGKKGFADNDPSYVVFKEIGLSQFQNERTIHSNQLSNLFDDPTGFGTIRLFAEIIINGTYYRTKTICISKYANSDFTGKLTEIFNLPYILGSNCVSRQVVFFNSLIHSSRYHF
jgi:hypothetical protein